MNGATKREHRLSPVPILVFPGTLGGQSFSRSYHTACERIKHVNGAEGRHYA